MKRILSVLFLFISATLVLAAPPLPSTPASVKALLYARPFTLDQGFRFDWRQEGPVVKEGYLLVIDVNPDMVYPRQTAEPVLYVGNQTAMRLNVGYNSSRVIALVPGTTIASKRIWFGTPQLPEAVNAATISKELALAEQKGIAQSSDMEINEALKRGGQPMIRGNFNELMTEAAKLIQNYAPDENELAKVLATQNK